MFGCAMGCEGSVLVDKVNCPANCGVNSDDMRRVCDITLSSNDV